MLELEYQGGQTTKRWRRRGVHYRIFELAGTSADLDGLIANLNAVAGDGRPVVAPISESGAAAWLVIARSDADLELVHLNPGLMVAGDEEALRDVARQTGWCVQQAGGPRPLHGYHTYIDLHDVYELSRGRPDHGLVGELKIVWVDERGTAVPHGSE